MPEGSGSLRVRMSKEENKGRVLVIIAVLFCGLLGDVRICSEEGGSSVDMWKMCLLAGKRKRKKSKFLGFLLRLHN